MSKLTIQEYRNLIIERAEQGKLPSGNKNVDGFYCKYRDKNGNACNIGLTFPDEVYRPLMDNFQSDDIGIPAHVLYVEFPVTKEYIPEGLTIEDMRFIQGIHDTEAYAGWNKDNFIYNINKFFDGLQSKASA